MDYAALIGYIVLAAATLAAAVVAARGQRRTRKMVQTNHGKTIGQHVEAAALDAKQANTNAQLVQLQLEQYKQEQAAAGQRLHDVIQQYVDADALAHTELRSLIMQVALGQEPPKS